MPASKLPRAGTAWFEALIDELPIGKVGKDAKTRLQEWLQAPQSPRPEYQLVEAIGEEHARTFRVLVPGSPNRPARPKARAVRCARPNRRPRPPCSNNWNTHDTPPSGPEPSPWSAGPNVGKSTLINSLVGAKVSIVRRGRRRPAIACSASPRCRRPADAGGHARHPRQAAAGDEPLHERAARGAVSDVDAGDPDDRGWRWTEDDSLAYSALKESGVACVLVINKVDKIADKTKLFPFIAESRTGASSIPCIRSRR
jgi:hypothetical protein